MKIILTTLNSKYTHTSMSLRLIGNWLIEKKFNAQWMEYTINTPLYQIIGDLYRSKPEVLIFSVYIWNAEETRAIASQLKKLLPQTIIIFGGPEVSFDSVEELKTHQYIDFITTGEGEAVTESLLLEIMKPEEQRLFASVKGLTWRNEIQVVQNESQDNLDMNLLAFPYPDLDALSNRILYYESSRGCPYNCSYCLSSATKGVRFRDDELVKKDLHRFMAANVMQVKFIDRTFNANPDRALRLWKFLFENDNGITNFHFEITAELLRDQDIEFLKTTRSGLFQFEVGIQTTMKEAREAVNRRLSFEEISKPVSSLLDAGNIHIHLDLIAGLPFESYHRFLESFNDVYALNPQVLQLGFLKLIKGSGIRVQELQHGYIYEDYQPYEVLANNYISFDELLELKDIEECLEHLHNSKRFIKTLALLLSGFEKPSQCFESLAQWIRTNGHFNEAIKMDKWYEFVWLYANENAITDVSLLDLRAALVYDYMTSQGKQPPVWMLEGIFTDVKNQAFDVVKTSWFEEQLPFYGNISPKERIKKIRFIGIDQTYKDVFIRLFKNKTVKIQDDASQNSILIVELSKRHPVNNIYESYLII